MIFDEARVYDIVKGCYSSNVKYYGIAIVAHKKRIRGGWKRK